MITELQTVNRLLASTSALRVEDWSKAEDVTEYYTTQYVYPVRDVFEDAKDFCEEVGLLESKNSKVRLSSIGDEYLSLGNRDAKGYILEPNQKQKDFLSRRVFLTAPTLDLTSKILYLFHRDQDGGLRLSKEEVSALEDQNLLQLLLQLEILIENKDAIQLAPQYADLLEPYISGNLMVITPEKFKQSEVEKEELSKIAEEFVLQSERKRLKSMGAIEQSKKVDHIALRNVAAGYDIVSFNDQDSNTHDRFIEVKAGKSRPIRFFFSRNEFETAKRLKGKYSIYYVCVKDKRPQEIYIFSDPTVGVMKDAKFEIRIDTYEVQEK